MSKTKSKGEGLIPFIAGGLTGAIEASITYPTEYMKTKMQLYKEYSKMGLINTFKHTYQNYGVKGFYRGLSVLVFFSTPKTGIRFFANHNLRTKVFTEKNRVHTFCAGVGAGITEAIFVVTPMETIKTKLIHDKLANTKLYRGLFHGIYTIVAEKGFSGIYKGLLPTIMKQGSNQGIRFLVFEDMKKILLGMNCNETLALFLSGGCAGAASVFANNPVDVVKTQMQGLDAGKYKGPLDCMKRIYAEEGLKGFYKGTIPRLSRVVLDVALTFTFYSKIKSYIVNTLKK